MTKNLMFKDLIQRKRPMSNAMVNVTQMLCSNPKMLLEVFIRKNFGERYFSFPQAMFLTLILAVIPVVKSLDINLLMRYRTGQNFDIIEFLLHDLTWYLFLAGFVAMCIDREIEVQRQPNVFQFGRLSLSTGQIHPGFLRLAPFGKPLSVRTIETIIEPGYFLIIGLTLWLLQQHVGILLTVCSICYSASYRTAYFQGDHFIMDKIDEIIFNEEMTNAFIDGLSPDKTRGVNIRGRKPVNQDDRRKIVDNLVVEEHFAVAM